MGRILVSERTSTRSGFLNPGILASASQRSKRSEAVTMNPLVHGSEPAVKTDVLSNRQVAQLLGVGEATVKRWADCRRDRLLRTPGGHRKFRLRDVTAFVQAAELRGGGDAPGAADAREEAAATRQSRRWRRAPWQATRRPLIAQMAALRLHGHELAAIFDDVGRPGAGAHRRTLGGQQAERRGGARGDAGGGWTPSPGPSRSPRRPGEPNRGDRGTAVVAAVAGSSTTLERAWRRACSGRGASRCWRPLAATPAGDLADLVVRSRAQLVALASTLPPEGRALQEQVELAARAPAVEAAGWWWAGRE